jgi:hypothetical protein
MYQNLTVALSGRMVKSAEFGQLSKIDDVVETMSLESQ